MEDNIFVPLEEQDEQSIEIETNNNIEENLFVAVLPNWDLEPPYETIKRGES